MNVLPVEEVLEIGSVSPCLPIDRLVARDVWWKEDRHDRVPGYVEERTGRKTSGHWSTKTQFMGFKLERNDEIDRPSLAGLTVLFTHLRANVSDSR